MTSIGTKREPSPQGHVSAVQTESEQQKGCVAVAVADAAGRSACEYPPAASLPVAICAWCSDADVR